LRSRGPSTARVWHALAGFPSMWACSVVVAQTSCRTWLFDIF